MRERLQRLLLLFACCVWFPGCSGIQSPLDAAAPQAERIEDLWWLMFYILTVVYLIVMLVLMFATFRRRRGEVVTESAEPKPERRASRNVSVAVGATVVILFVLLVSSFLVGRGLFPIPPGSSPLTVEVTGHQWWWAVRYLHPVPSQTLTTANEIHLPVNRPVLFRLNSTDVIHSFWVPNLHGKTDLIPGHPAETWITPTRVGVFRGQCAEFCGYQHAHMSFVVVVEPEEQFKNWYAAQLQSAPTPSTPETLRGQQVFLSGPCVMCHRIQGTDAGGNVGPDLTHVASRQTIAAGTLDTSRDHLRQWITDSQQYKPGNRMPPVPLAHDDLERLLDYIQSLK